MATKQTSDKESALPIQARGAMCSGDRMGKGSPGLPSGEVTLPHGCLTVPEASPQKEQPQQDIVSWVTRDQGPT